MCLYAHFLTLYGRYASVKTIATHKKRVIQFRAIVLTGYQARVWLISQYEVIDSHHLKLFGITMYFLRRHAILATIYTTIQSMHPIPNLILFLGI